jgi:hypothetical protein
MIGAKSFQGKSPLNAPAVRSRDLHATAIEELTTIHPNSEPTGESRRSEVVARPLE